VNVIFVNNCKTSVINIMNLFKLREFLFKFLIFINLIILTTSTIFSQNIYDFENSLKFANYLFENKEYKFANEEFERLVFMLPNDEELEKKLIKSYRLSEYYEQGIKYIQNNYNDSIIFLNSYISVEYIKLLILNNENSLALYFLENSKNIDNITKYNYQVAIYLIENEYEKAQDVANKYKDYIQQNLFEIVNQTSKIKYKSKLIAVSLSTILPGSGKIYAGVWKDGMFSLTLISLNSWQAFRGFNKFGFKSIYGWIFGGMASGFYFGNIYGSSKAVYKHNFNINENIKTQTYNFLYNSF